MEAVNGNSKETPQWVTMAAAKKLLGCSEAWVYKLAGSKRVARQDAPGGYLYSSTDIAKYLGSEKDKPKASPKRPHRKKAKLTTQKMTIALPVAQKKPATIMSASMVEKMLSDTKTRFQALMGAFDADILTVGEMMTVLRRLIGEL